MYEFCTLVVVGLSEKIVFLGVPIVEKLEKLDVFGQNVLVFFGVKAPYYI